MTPFTFIRRVCPLLLGLSLPWLLQGQTITGITNTSGFANFGAVGDQVTIWGTAFANPTPVVSVRFNGVPITWGGITSDSTITVRVPAGATTGPVTVQKATGSPAFSPQDFVVIGAGPYIASFSPSVGAQGTPVTLNGVHFTTATAVSFNGVSVPKNSFLTHTDIRIIVPTPPGVTTGPLSVVSPLGNTTASNTFYVPPVINGFSPTSGVALSEFTIKGTNFIDTSSVRIGNFEVPIYQVTANTQIVATVPSGAISGPIRVTTPGGLFQTPSNFTLLPSITGFTPTIGTTNTQVTISGANLNVLPLSVQFNGVAATIVSSNFQQIVATAPASSSGPIKVTTKDGSATSSGVFHYPPSITSFSPGFGGAGTLVNLNGRSFTNATSVRFAGVPAMFFTVSNSVLIQAAAPLNVSTGPLTVSAPGGDAVSTDSFYGPATLTGFFPPEGRTGTNVTLIGSNFEGATGVAFNGTPAPILANAGTSIGTQVPANATSGFISVTTPAGTVFSTSVFVVPGASDLRVNTFLTTPNPVMIENDLTLNLVPSNDGPSIASNVIASVTLAPGLTVKSASTTKGSVNTNANPVVFSIGSMTRFENPTLTLVLVPHAAGVLTNTVTVSSETWDPNPANNSDARVTTVLPVPELSIGWSGGNQIRIAWPLLLTNWVLQSSLTLPHPAPWANVPGTPLIEGNQRVVTEPTTGAAKYYRLSK